MKATAIAPSNIAFIKYWGKKDGAARLPANSSLSMNLSNLLTTTTVEFSAQLKQDEFQIDGQMYSPDSDQARRAFKHIDLIRKMAGNFQKVKVASRNNFPSGTGLSSSASGFAALTVAAAVAANLALSEKELSILARRGSGSACRSIPNGFVEWSAGDTDDESYAFSVFPSNYWDIADVVVVISTSKKQVSSTEGQEFASTSPFYKTRLSNLSKRLEETKELIKNRDFEKFGEIIEAEALELHAIMLTSKPSLIYWQPQTITLMKEVHNWRRSGLLVFFSLNTGQDVHLICQQKDVPEVRTRLANLPEVIDVIPNAPATGARISEKHLF